LRKIASNRKFPAARRRRLSERPSPFIGFAPVENPKIAWAVIVEGGGYGARRLGADRGQSAGESEEPRIIE